MFFFVLQQIDIWGVICRILFFLSVYVLLLDIYICIDWNEFVLEDFIFVYLFDNFFFKKLCVFMFFFKKMLFVGNGMFKEIIFYQIDFGKKMNFY